MLYETLRPLARIALRWYYRSITVAGAERLPREGPVFLAVNHPNALVDAMVVGCSMPRRVRFTAKATIFANPLASWFLRTVGVVPLRRASDETPRAGADASPAATDANDPAPNDPARNAAAFGAVADALAEGAAVVIFPEGKSHDEPALAPLRTGLARMVQVAHTRGVRGVRIVPIGLLFERKEEPRTRVLVQVGDPIDVDALPDVARSVGALTDLVAARLAAVTLNFDTPDDAERIALIGETLGALLEPARDVSDDVVPLGVTLSIVRRVARVHAALAAQQPPNAPPAERAAHFETRLRAFRDRLAAQHIDVHDLDIAHTTAPGVRFVLREGAIGALLLPLVLWGRLTHVLPVRLARALALRNVRARDEPAMRTVVNGLALVLLAYGALTALVWTIAGGWWALLFLASLVPSASSDFRYGDRWRRASARARTYRAFRRQPALQRELQTEAEWLKGEAAALEGSV